MEITKSANKKSRKNLQGIEGNEVIEKGTTTRPPPKRRPARICKEGSGALVLVRCRSLFQRSQILFCPAVVDAQEFVGSSSHVDQIGIALGALLVHELVYRIILRLGLDEAVHHEEQGSAKFG